MKKFFVLSLVLLSCVTVFSTAKAGIYGDELTKCLVNSASAEDKIALAKWMGLAIVQHQAVAPLVTTSQQDLMDVTIDAGDMVIELLGKVCQKEANAALKYEGQTAMTHSFEYFGRVAVQELMIDANVKKAFGLFGSYLKKNLNKNLKKKN